MKNKSKKIIGIALAASICISLFVPGLAAAGDQEFLDEQVAQNEVIDTTLDPEVVETSGKEYVCGISEHVHNDSCYEQQLVWTCQSALGLEVLHRHDSLCYNDDGNLICYLTETEAHEHSDSCYELVENPEPDIPELGNNELESNDECENQDVLDSGVPDAKDEETSELAPELNSSEIESQRTNIDELQQDSEDVHESVYALAPIDIQSKLALDGVLVCGRQDTSGWPEHQHDESCLVYENILTCNMTEHEHNENCLKNISSNKNVDGLIDFINKLCDNIESGLYTESDIDELAKQYAIISAWMEDLIDITDAESAQINEAISRLQSLLTLDIDLLASNVSYTPKLNLIDVSGTYDGDIGTTPIMYRWQLTCPDDDAIILPSDVNGLTLTTETTHFGVTSFPEIKFTNTGTYEFHLACTNKGTGIFADVWTLTVTVSEPDNTMTANGVWTLDNSTKGITCNNVAEIRVMMGEEQTWSATTIMQAEKIMQNMTLEEKVGQLFLVHYPNDGAGTVSAANALIEKYHIGGYLVFAAMFKNSTPTSVRQKIADTQAASAIPLLFTVDEEGGTVVRVSSYSAFRSTKFQSPQDLKDSGGLSAVWADAIEKAAFLKDLGLNVNHAPVADVSGSSGYIYNRTYGGDGLENASYVSTVVSASVDAGIGTTMKHFPGYGGTSSNTHNGFAVNDLTWVDFLYDDLLPFYAGMTAGGRAVMVTHNTINCLDTANPSSLSPAIYDMLRNQLHFDGVAMTDDLNMSAITNFVGDGYASLSALQAGADMAMTNQPDKDIPIVLAAVKNGEFSLDRVEESCRRILCWKIEMGIIEPDAIIDTTVSIKYAASEGGTVSVTEELLSADSIATGSIASAYDEYQFVYWVDNFSGEIVGFDETLIPSKNTYGQYEAREYTAVFKKTTNTGIITAQYYAWMDEIVYNSPQYRKVIGSTSYTNEMPIIDTSGSMLPKNGQGTTASPNNREIRNIYVDMDSGQLITERHLVSMYSPRTIDMLEDIYVNSIDTFGNKNYILSQIWVLKSGKDADSLDPNDWYVYNYNDSLVFKICDDNPYCYEAEPVDNEILLENGAVVRYVADCIMTETNLATAFYDYDIGDGYIYSTQLNAQKQSNRKSTSTQGTGTYHMHTNQSGINSSENYTGTGTKLAFGNANTGSGLQHELWTGNLLNKYNGTQSGHPSVTGSYKGCTFGLAIGLVDGKIQYASGINAPNLFDDGSAVGKTPYDNNEFSLVFAGTGNSYTLTAVKGSDTTNLDTFNHPSPNASTIHNHIWTNNFWPMDSAESFGTDGHDMKFGDYTNRENYKFAGQAGSSGGSAAANGTFPCSDDGKDHNSYFGMMFKFDIEVNADYIGPMDYYFYGDDDMWIFLNDTLVGDIGGVHSSVGTYVNFWDWIDKDAERIHTHDNTCYDNEENLVCGYTDSKVFRISVFYTERGESGSTCFMQFNVPSIVSVPVNSSHSGNLQVSKEVVFENSIGENSPSAIFSDVEFPFTVKLFDANGNELTQTFSYTGTKSGTISSGGVVYLGNNDKILIQNVPSGTLYTVTEKGTDGYTCTSINAAGEILLDDTVSARFINIAKVGSIEFTKVDDYGNLIPDVEFALFSNADCTDIVAAVVSDSSGVVRFDGLLYGDYYMKEMSSQEGYYPNESIYGISIMGDVGVLMDENGDIIHQIVNYHVGGPELPSTGGIGFTEFYIVGTVIIFITLVMLIIKTKRK